MVIGGVEGADAVITTVKDLLAVWELESFTVKVNSYDPAVVGEPLRTPALKVSPGGNMPAV
jgi:hypothetical protein